MNVHRLDSVHIDAVEHMRYKTPLNLNAATATARLETAIGKAHANQIDNPCHNQAKQQQEARQPAYEHKIDLGHTRRGKKCCAIDQNREDGQSCHNDKRSHHCCKSQAKRCPSA